MGTYIALAALNRVCDPCSKLAFSDWWAKTAADRWLHLPASALDHRRFWDAMGAMGEEQLKEAERRIVAHMVGSFGVDLSGLVLDMTNFATWIASANDRAPIAQRGHSKQKRADLRLVGLGLVVSVDGGIPLVSHAYPGNRPDVTQFGDMVSELARRFQALVGDEDGAGRLTLVFDAGQNSEGNYDLLDSLPFHFVGSLPPSDHPDLLAVAKAVPGGGRAALPGAGGLRDRKGRLRPAAPGRGDPLRGPACQAVRRVRPDAGQGPPPVGRPRRPAWPGARQKGPRTKSRRRWPKY